MVILQFNKLIRNKWIWGAFAIAISAFFCLDDVILRDREERVVGSVGTLAGEKVDPQTFESIAEEIRGIGRNRDWKTNQGDVNRQAWENYAALQVAGEAGLEATDAEVTAVIRRDPSFQQNGAFSFSIYQLILRENSLTPERYEVMLKRSLTLRRVAQHVLGSAVWASPMELDQAVADMTDVFTVKVATFTQNAAAAAAVKVDEPQLKKWYDENVKDLGLPERVKIRFVKFDATKPELLAKLAVTEDDLRDRYDTTIDKYTTTDTNGVEKVQAFEEVRGEIEKDLRKVLAVECLQTNLNYRAYAVKTTVGSSRLDEIAKEEGLTVSTSDWFATDGGWQEGFMKRPYQILPGAQGFAEAVAELDPESEDLRYAVVSSDRAVWLVEKVATSPKHTPSFDEAKDAIRPRVLRAAKAEAFKSAVEAVIAKGSAAVMGADKLTDAAFKATVSTNLTFAVADLKPGDFPDQNAVARAVSKVAKGGLSEFTLTGTGHAVVVACEDRKEGDAAKAMVLRSQIQNDVTTLAANEIPTSWKKWNLERLGFETTERSSVEKVEVDE